MRRYLDEPPTPEELDAVLQRLGLEPWDIARPKEAKEAGLDLPRDAGHRGDWLQALAEHPRVIQRPIITAERRHHRRRPRRRLARPGDRGRA